MDWSWVLVLAVLACLSSSFRLVFGYAAAVAFGYGTVGWPAALALLAGFAGLVGALARAVAIAYGTTRATQVGFAAFALVWAAYAALILYARDVGQKNGLTEDDMSRGARALALMVPFIAYLLIALSTVVFVVFKLSQTAGASSPLAISIALALTLGTLVAWVSTYFNTRAAERARK